MNVRYAVLGIILLAAAAACTTSPASPAGVATVTTAISVAPANGAVIANINQPVTLAVNNAHVTSGTSSVNYTFEVATDSAFASKVQTKSVAQNSSGQTTAVLDSLTAGRDYYWHVRTTGGDTVGVFTEPVKFTVGPAVTLAAPTPTTPLSGASLSNLRPTFTVTNATRTGPAGTVVYRFDIATNAAFTTIAVSATVPEGSGSTSFTPTSDLAADVAFFWRAQAVDTANSVSSAFSTSQSVTTITSIDLNTVNYQRFVNISKWPIGTTVTSVDQDGGDGHMCVGHSQSGTWPTSDFFNDPAVQVEGNQWYFARINGQWYGGSGEWMRKGQTCKSGQYTENIGPDGTWGGPMDTWAPKVGELVGYMITTPARDWPNFKTTDQRSAIVLVPWRDSRVK